MHWYKISEGNYPDEYVEITLGHEEKYSKEEFTKIVTNTPHSRVDADLLPGHRLVWEISKTLVKNYGFKILPVEHQHHFKD